MIFHKQQMGIYFSCFSRNFIFENIPKKFLKPDNGKLKLGQSDSTTGRYLPCTLLTYVLLFSKPLHIADLHSIPSTYMVPQVHQRKHYKALRKENSLNTASVTQNTNKKKRLKINMYDMLLQFQINLDYHVIIWYF